MPLPEAHLHILELAAKKTLFKAVPPELQEALKDMRTAGYVDVKAGNMHDPQRLLLTQFGASRRLESLGTAAQPMVAAKATTGQEEVPLFERLMAVLTPNQCRIVERLWAKKTLSYDALLSIPGAWRDKPTDEAITKQLKEIRDRLEAANLIEGYIKISAAKRRVTLDGPGAKPGTV